MNRKNKVFIATSLDGYIAEKDGGLDWLNSDWLNLDSNTDDGGMGYEEFINTIDALVMGRITFETVKGFDVPWPYKKPVFVLSNTMIQIPKSHKEKAFLVKGDLKKVLRQIHEKGYCRLYIDGGTTISNFLKEDLIDEMTITTIPTLLGGGYPLFHEMPNRLNFELVESKVYKGQIIQNHYKRVK
ncbi:MAG: diacylglycerol kinase [Candidatus Cloacimonadota bacterium]|nr:MAG: diacylglycerol kinase [Candidatus Cloacimonadota bacterium]PIE79001.1 MAG: diacylglycerol kinase [Candidatus Delongbacteria bacterium]